MLCGILIVPFTLAYNSAKNCMVAFPKRLQPHDTPSLQSKSKSRYNSRKSIDLVDAFS